MIARHKQTNECRCGGQEGKFRSPKSTSGFTRSNVAHIRGEPGCWWRSPQPMFFLPVTVGVKRLRRQVERLREGIRQECYYEADVDENKLVHQQDCPALLYELVPRLCDCAFGRLRELLDTTEAYSVFFWSQNAYVSSL